MNALLKSSLLSLFAAFLTNTCQGQMPSKLPIANITQLAERGDADAQVELYNKYRAGNGVTTNYVEALRWLKIAASSGSAKAYLEVGDLYYFGDENFDIKTDYNKAVTWYTKAKEKGNIKAYGRLGQIYRLLSRIHGRDRQLYLEYAQTSFNYYQESAKRGDAQGQYELGRLHEEGVGCEKDTEKALEFYEKSAKNGFFLASEKVGDLYFDGKGTPQNYKVAAAWYLKSAESFGFWQSQYKIALMYAKGHGVPKDMIEAYRWVNLAASQSGSSDEVRMLRDSLVGQMTPSQIDIAQRPSPSRRAPQSQSSSLVDPFEKKSSGFIAPENMAVSTGFVAPENRATPPTIQSAQTKPLTNADFAKVEAPPTAAITTENIAAPDNQSSSPVTTYQNILRAGFWAYVLALIVAFLLSKQTSIHKSKPIGGWITFFCVTLTFLSPMFSIGRMEVDRQQLGASLTSPFLTPMVVESLGIIAFTIYGVFIGVKIWSRSPRGIQLARTYLLSRLFVLPAITIIAFTFMPPQSNSALDALVGNFIITIIFVGIWWLYFAKSKRVKDTYAATQTTPPALPQGLAMPVMPQTSTTPPIQPISNVVPPPPPLHVTSTDKKETVKMNPARKGVLTGAIMFTLLLVMFWPTLETKRVGRGENGYTKQYVEVRGDGPLCMSYVFGFALLSGMAGLVVGSLSGRKQ